MVTTQHTEATRKKLREAAFFLRQLADVSHATVMSPEPEASEFYLSAFLSAVRAVQWALKMERTAEWNAWNHEHWFALLSDGDRKLWEFFVDQRNKVHKQGGPEITITVTPVSLFEFMQEVSRQGGHLEITHSVPGTPLPKYTKFEKAFIDRPGQTLAQACQPIFDLVSRMVDQFEHDHPPAAPIKTL